MATFHGICRNERKCALAKAGTIQEAEQADFRCGNPECGRPLASVDDFVHRINRAGRLWLGAVVVVLLLAVGAGAVVAKMYYFDRPATAGARSISGSAGRALTGMMPGTEVGAAEGSETRDSASAPKGAERAVAAAAIPEREIPRTPSVTETPELKSTPAATPAAPPPAKPKPEDSTKIVMRLHGSNTIGSALAAELVTAFLKAKKGADDPRIVQKGPEERLVEFKLPDGTRAAVQIESHGSATAFKSLEAGLCDIGMSSRPVNAEEIELLKKAGLGDMTSRSAERPFARDGVAVIVNPANPIERLDRTQLREIFTGQTTSWGKVGGSDASIQLYARDDKSGTFDTFKSLVLGKEKLGVNSVRFEDTGELVQRVAKDVGGIGFAGVGFARERASSIRILAIGDAGGPSFVPTSFTIQQGNYLLRRLLFFYVPENGRAEDVDRFLDFVLTAPAQEIVRKCGFFDFTPEALPSSKIAVPSDAPDEYRKIVKAGCEQLSVSFRFAPNSDELDNEARVQLDKLVNEIQDNPRYAKGKIYLFGYSDGQGTDEGCARVSERRAAAAQRMLNERGIPTLTRGFGKRCRIIPKEVSEEDRRINRRVEIWIQPG